MDGGFRLPPPPTAKLQYVERKMTTFILKVGARCRACEKEGEELEEGEKRWTMGQRFWLREGRERRERQRLLMGMVEGLRGWIGERKRKRGGEVEDLVRGEEWWGGGVTEMGGLLGKEEVLVTEENVEQIVEQNVVVEVGAMDSAKRNPVAKAGSMGAAKPKDEWRRFFKSKQLPGTIEGGGVFSGFKKVGQSGNMWRWDGGLGVMDMQIANGANLNLEIPDSNISHAEFEMEAPGRDDMLTQGMDIAATDPAMQASLDAQLLTNGHFPARRISDGGTVFEEDDSGFTFSSTFADETETAQRIGEGGEVWGGDDAGAALENQMMDITMPDASLEEGMDAFVRGMLVDSVEGAGRRVGADGLVEAVMRDGYEVDEGGVRATDNTWSEFDEDEVVEREDDSGSEYEPTDV